MGSSSIVTGAGGSRVSDRASEDVDLIAWRGRRPYRVSEAAGIIAWRGRRHGRVSADGSLYHILQLASNSVVGVRCHSMDRLIAEADDESHSRADLLAARLGGTTALPGSTGGTCA